MNRLGYPRKNFWISKTVTLIYSKRHQDLMKAPDYGTKNVDKLLDDQITTRRAKKPKFIKKNIRTFAFLQSIRYRFVEIDQVLLKVKKTQTFTSFCY